MGGVWMVSVGGSGRDRRTDPAASGGRAAGSPDVGVPSQVGVRVPEQHDWITCFLRARVVSRRAALRDAAGALAVLGTGAWTRRDADSRALPGLRLVPAGLPLVVGRRVSFGNDPQRQMAVAAELTARPGQEVLVDLGVDGE